MRREPGRTMTGPLFQRAVETLRTQEALETRDGVSLFVLNQPIANQERCQGCHGTDHQVRAVVRVATSMEPVLAQVELQRNHQIVIAILTIVTAAAVLAVAMRFVVVRPIHELTRVARRIGEGDFQARAPASGDEVGELGTALNDMTVRLSQAQQDLSADYGAGHGARTCRLPPAESGAAQGQPASSCRRRQGLPTRSSATTLEKQRGGLGALSRHRATRA
jgi:HAMP domain-containing protein